MVDARDGLRLTRLTGAQEHPARPRCGRGRRGGGSCRGREERVSSSRAAAAGEVDGVPGGGRSSRAGNQPMTLRLPQHATADYRGALRSVEKHTVNVLSLDRYVQGVVPREVPASWPAEAVRAQAVAARTYAAYERAAPRRRTTTSATPVLPGVRRSGRRGPGLQRRGARDPRPGRASTRASRRSPSSPRATAAAARPGRSPTSPPSPTPTRRPRATPTTTWTATLTSAQIEKEWPEIGHAGTTSRSPGTATATSAAGSRSVDVHRQRRGSGAGHRRRRPLPAGRRRPVDVVQARPGDAARPVRQLVGWVR